MNMQSTAKRKIEFTRRLEKLFIFLTGMFLAGVICFELLYECPYDAPRLPNTEIALGLGTLICGYAAYCYSTFATKLADQVNTYRRNPSRIRKRAIGAMLHANLLRIVLCK